MKFIRIVFLIPAFSISTLFAQEVKVNENSRAEILRVFSAQETAWNNYDLEGFMAGYWKSDSLVFVGKSGATFGWNKTLANYKKSYPDPAAMGKLTMEILRMSSLGKNYVLVIGKWKLDREKDVLEGHFSLCWKKIKGKWLIIADHSS